MTDVFNGIVRTNVTNMAGMETNVLIIIIEESVSVVPCVITVVTSSSF